MQEVINWRFPEADITWKECRKGLEFNCLNRSEHEECVVIQGEIAEDDKLDYILR